MRKLKKVVRNNLLNIPGWHTKRKIVVIESDDWGAIRLPNKEVLEKLQKAGIRVENDHYIQNDSLASEQDLELLFGILNSLNKVEKVPVITANSIMANPDFEKIRNDRFERYHYEMFTETLKRYPEHGKAFDLWKEGMKNGTFKPQFHGREHLQVGRWMKGLADDKSETYSAFDHELYALCTSTTSEDRKSYMAAYEWDNEQDKRFNLQAVEDGLNLFEEVFGFRSLSAIAPNYTWNRDVELVMHLAGVKYLQGSSVQRSPELGQNGNKTIRHYTGQKNKTGQIYMVRNCWFEPTSNPYKDWVDSCLGDIKTAFRWNKPAIIESHRVNYVGFINPNNRDQNLKKLDQLLKMIVKTWPDVEFMSSDQLGKVIEES